jgi:PAS domain S-box-containing protein
MIVSSVDLARCLFTSSRDGLLQICPSDGRIIDANSAIEQLTGLSREQLLWMRVEELLHSAREGEDVGHDEPNGDAGCTCFRLGRCDLLVSVSRHAIEGESGSGPGPVELVIVREITEFCPDDYENWVDSVVVTDATGRIAFVNSASRQLAGWVDDWPSGTPLSQMFDADSQQRLLDGQQQLRDSGIEVVGEFALRHVNGEPVSVEMWSRPVTYMGRPAALNVLRDLTDQKRMDVFHTGQMQILEQLALGHELTPILEALILLIEWLFEGTRASVLLLDDDGVTLRHGAAPSLPNEYNALIDGLKSGPTVGSCGTAVYRKERVVVFDTRTDPLWAGFQDLAARFEHRACWSQPVLSTSGDVCGTFALYYRQPRRPSSFELEVIEKAAHLAGIAIQRFRSERALSQSRSETARQRRELELILDAVQAQVVYMDTEARVIRHNRYSREVLGLSDDDIRGLNVIAQAPHLDEPEKRHQQSLDVIRSGQARLGSIESYNEDGGRRWVSVDKVPTFDNDGQVNGLVLFIYDITKLKQAENLVRESELRFRQLAQNIGSAFWMADEIENQIVYVSPPYERIFGQTCEDMNRDPELFLKSVVPEDRERVRRKIERQRRGESTFEEYRIRRPDGSVRWLRD